MCDERTASGHRPSRAGTAAESTELLLPRRLLPELLPECECKQQPTPSVSPQTSPLPCQRCDPNKTTTLAAKNNLLKTEVDLLVDRLAQVTAENTLLMRRIRTLRREPAGSTGTTPTASSRPVECDNYNIATTATISPGCQASNEEESPTKSDSTTVATTAAAVTPAARSARPRSTITAAADSFTPQDRCRRTDQPHHDVMSAAATDSTPPTAVAANGFGNDKVATPFAENGTGGGRSSQLADTASAGRAGQLQTPAPNTEAMRDCGASVSPPTRLDTETIQRPYCSRRAANQTLAPLTMTPKDRSVSPPPRLSNRPPPACSMKQTMGSALVDDAAADARAPDNRCSGVSDVDLEDLVFVVGHALLDICAVVDQLFLTKYCLRNDDVILARPEHKCMLNDLQTNWPVFTIPGGSSQSSARVVQWFLGVKRSTTVFGCIGTDEKGNILADHMKKSGVTLRYAIDNQSPTGVCCVCIVGANRSIVTQLGAAASLRIEHLRDPGTRKLMQRAELFYLEAFSIHHSYDVVREVSEYASQHNVHMAFNLSARYICIQFPDAMRDVVQHADFVFGNRSEARAFACAQQLPADGIAEIARLISGLPKANGSRGRVVVITDGPQPTVVAENGVVHRFPVLPLQRDELVDTVGAGDAFVGGFLAGIVTGADTERCVALANQAARFVVGRHGCDIPVGQAPIDAVDFTLLKQRRSVRNDKESQ